MDITGKELVESVEKIAFQAGSLQSVIRTTESDKAKEFKELQNKMQAINAEICDTKIKMGEQYFVQGKRLQVKFFDRRNKLQLEEVMLKNELEDLRKDMPNWNRCRNRSSLKMESTKSRINPSVLQLTEKPQAVVDFEKYVLASGGMTGGWDDFDHKEYLIFRQRNGPIHADLAEEAVREIPTKNSADIVEHELWYVKFAALLVARKEALMGWKSAKEKQKAGQALELQEEERRKKIHIEKIRAEVQKKRKLVLTSQKATKERNDRLKAELAAQLRLNRDIKTQEKFREHQATLKERLGDHYNELDQKLWQLQLEQKRKLGDLQNQRHIANIQVRELGVRELLRAKQRAMRKQEEKLKKESQTAMQKLFAENLRRRVSGKVTADPSRLVKLTEGWQHRLAGSDFASSGDANGKGVGLKCQGLEEVFQSWQVPANILDLSKLKTPSWRNKEK